MLDAILKRLKLIFTRGDITGDFRITSYEGLGYIDYHIELLYEDKKWRYLEEEVGPDFSLPVKFTNSEDAKVYAIKYLKFKLNSVRSSVIYQSKAEVE